MDFPAKAILMSACLQQLFPERYCLPPLEMTVWSGKSQGSKVGLYRHQPAHQGLLAGRPLQVRGPFCQMFSVHVPPMVPGTSQAPIFSHMFVFANSSI